MKEQPIQPDIYIIKCIDNTQRESKKKYDVAGIKTKRGKATTDMKHGYLKVTSAMPSSSKTGSCKYSWNSLFHFL